MATRTIEIAGMSCGHCVKAVTLALQDVSGVDVKDVRVGSAVIDVDASVTPEALAQAIDEAGFTLTSSTET
ncbi:MAG: heavy-metal-associated domain-containing protein [Acidobacteria bacterium]|nr:heavy-metal-associated domain-containing protein [Acidobacteriota bacterium]